MLCKFLKRNVCLTLLNIEIVEDCSEKSDRIYVDLLNGIINEFVEFCSHVSVNIRCKLENETFNTFVACIITQLETKVLSVDESSNGGAERNRDSNEMVRRLTFKHFQTEDFHWKNNV